MKWCQSRGALCYANDVGDLVNAHCARNDRDGGAIELTVRLLLLI